jgi:hypothetical protein
LGLTGQDKSSISIPRMSAKPAVNFLPDSGFTLPKLTDTSNGRYGVKARGKSADFIVEFPAFESLIINRRLQSETPA